ncbi:hypothetical protein ACQPW1_09370 [Nocardia sp. CA-128927]|uniref:hypothetical protein n=1 Tax=Nocardia sp. CA-128927 TaxID=3239975 RepID=UPI003D97920A
MDTEPEPRRRPRTHPDYQPEPREITAEHLRLGEEFAAIVSPRWSEIAVSACLQWLMTSNATDARLITVEDARVEDEWTFVVVYRSQYFDGRLALRSSTYNPRDNTFSSMYSPELTSAPDPVRYGRDVADFDIGEPLGTVADRLRIDENGIQWWGSPPPTPT